MSEESHAQRDLADIERLRDRLVEYMNVLLAGGGGLYGLGPDEDTRRRLAEQRPWLAREFGRLFNLINRYGGMSMGSKALGITVVDVVAEAINNPGASSYHDIARSPNSTLIPPSADSPAT